MEATINKSLDRRGKSITTFVVFDAAAELGRMAEGQALEVITDEFEAFEWDMAAWCQATGHVIVVSEATPAGHRFVIEKREPKRKDTSLAIVISGAGLDQLLSPLGFALAAALEGMAVNLYFQGPAVRVLKRGFRPKLGGWGRPFSRFAAAGMAESGHIPAQEKLQQLRELGAHIYVCGGSLQPFKVSPQDLVFDDIPIVEYFTFMSIMEGADVQLYV